MSNHYALNAATSQHRGLKLHVARATLGDCTNRGVSATAQTLTLVGWTGWNRSGEFDVTNVVELDKLSQVFSPDGDSPAVALRLRRDSFGAGCTAHLVPVRSDGTPTGRLFPASAAMAGGNFASGDSRFSDLLAMVLGHRFYGAVAIHDRFEA
ncbi:hypothetical protein ACLM5J_19805 [Nocardioides sp. Bht2]|uniref:hypothetical protein n=1 Tax=Nocardioides sp. Bht2 TaxID=3392297 RepID=UPI0039B4B1E3